MKALLILLFFSFTLFSSERLDFNFKDMEFKVVVESIAKLINKNAVFLKGAESGKLVNFKLSNTTPEAALKLLMETNGYSSRIKGDILYIAAANDQSGGAADSKITVVVPLTHVIAKDIDAQIKSVAGTALTYTINEQLNAFIVTGNEEAIDGIRKLVIALDKEIAQIFIEAKIIETSKKFSREFGIEWGNPALRSSGGVSVTGGSASTGSAIGGTGINVNKSDITAGISLGLSSTSQLNAKISAAESNGDIKIISNPKISTLNGQTAVIEDSSTFTFRTVTSSGSGTGNITGLGAAGVEKIKAGLKFSVTPFLVSNEKVRFNISISKSSPSKVGDGIDGLPQVSESSANTSLIVRNGQTAAIAGIVSQNQKDNSSGVPFLSALPILGGLFGSDSTQKDTSEMMIFITPTIFKGHLEAARKIFKTNEDEDLAVEESRDELFDRLHGFEETQIISGADRVPASVPSAPFLSPLENSFKENKKP